MEKTLDTVCISTETEIIQKILAGEIALFEVLIRRYNAVLYKIARSYGFNHQDAEDLMQDTHVAAYTNLRKFEGRSSYKTWISRIMNHKCIYKLKYGYFKNEFPSEQIQELNKEPMYVKSKECQTEDLLMNRELGIVLEKSLQNIPVLYRTVFVLREIEGFSVAETADLMDITSVNVKVRLNRAKVLLQKQIEQVYTHTDLYSFNLIYCDAIVHKVFEKINAARQENNNNSLSSE